MFIFKNNLFLFIESIELFTAYANIHISKPLTDLQ